MDISFELAYPEHRWLGENVLQLYGERYFTDGSPDTLIIGNRTGRVIKHLKVTSVDQFLCFDLQPGDEIKLLNSRTRGGDKGFYVIGEFDDGRKIEGGTALKSGKGVSDPFTYYIYIDGDGPTFEGPQ